MYHCTYNIASNTILEYLYTHQYSVNDTQSLLVLLKYIIVAMTANKVSNNVWSSENKSNDVTTIPIVHDSIKV